MEDDVQERGDNKSWEQKQERWIADVKRKIEHGVRGDALAALHGLHAPTDEPSSYDMDEAGEIDDQGTLHHKIIRRLVEISDAISQNSKLPEEVKDKWAAKLQECSASEARSVALLRELRAELDSWDEIDPQSELSLVYAAIGALASMIEIYQRRFKIP